MPFFIKLWLIFALACQISADEGNAKLEMIQVIARHGVRSPSKTEDLVTNYNETDLFKIWGHDQLTDVGMKQMYRFGHILKQRYGSFLGNYDSENVYARSTDYDRTKASLLLTLAGLYLPELENPVWDKNLTFRPEFGQFEYEFLTLKEDVLFESQNSAGFHQEMKKYVTSQKFREKVEKYNSTLEVIKLHGNNVQKFRDFIFANIVFGFIHSLKTMNLSIPGWCTKRIYNDLKELFIIRTKAEEVTQDLKIIHAGPLLKEFLANMNDPEHKKAYFYSGHDLNMASIVETLQIANFDFPDFGCALILETWQDMMSENIKFVKLLGWLGNGNDMIPLRMQYCDKFCPKIVFDQILNSYVPNDEEYAKLKKEVAEFDPAVVKEYYYE